MMEGQGGNTEGFSKENLDLADEVLKVIEFHKSGISDTRIDSNRLSGRDAKVADYINEILDIYLGNLKTVHQSVKNLVNGDFETEIEKLPGKFSEMSDSIDTLKISLGMIKKDIDRISTTFEKGELNYHIDSAKYQGGFADIIDRLDEGIDAVARPVRVASIGISDFAEGKIPEIIDESTFQGDFKRLIHNINEIVHVSKMRGDDLLFLVTSAEEGRLDARADATKYSGYHGKMISGINGILDAYISPINVSAEYIDRISKGDIPPKIAEVYRGDFNEIKNNLNALIDVVHMRNADINLLIQAAVDGKLDFRADHTKYPGENGRMIEGINKMLDAYLGPLNVSAEYIDRISKGDPPRRLLMNTGEISTR